MSLLPETASRLIYQARCTDPVKRRETCNIRLEGSGGYSDEKESHYFARTVLGKKGAGREMARTEIWALTGAKLSTPTATATRKVRTTMLQISIGEETLARGVGRREDGEWREELTTSEGESRCLSLVQSKLCSILIQISRCVRQSPAPNAQTVTIIIILLLLSTSKTRSET